jgi:hypothetical protein
MNIVLSRINRWSSGGAKPFRSSIAGAGGVALEIVSGAVNCTAFDAGQAVDSPVFLLR